MEDTQEIAAIVSETRVEIEALAGRIAKISALSDALDRERLACIRRFDELEGWGEQGAQSCAHWLSWRVGLSAGAAREQVRVARALGKLPAIEAALGKAEVSYSKVRAMTRVATPENEATLLELARHATAAQVEVLCRKFQTVVNPGDPFVERFLRRTDLESGMVRLNVQLLPEEAAVVAKAIEAAIRLAHEGGVPAGTSARVDAFVSVCESFLADQARESSVPGRFEVSLHVPAETLRGESDEPGELEDGVRVSAETSRRLSCDAPIIEVLEGAEGSSLDLGRRTRRISAALRRALEARDRTCRFPGCTKRIWVDGHHVEHWSREGETKLSNLVLLCRSHHVLVHEGGYRVEVAEDGFLFFDPHGRRIDEVPEGASLPPDVLDELGRELPDIDEESNEPLWDGTRLDCGAAVGALLDAGTGPVAITTSY